MTPSTPASTDAGALADEMFGHAEKAYFKACETSDPQHWMEAALLAQQHRNALIAARKASLQETRGDEPVELRAALTQIDTIAVCVGVVDARLFRGMLANIADIARTALLASPQQSPRLEREGIALGDIVTMSERSPYFHDWRGIEMKVVSLRTAPDGKLWASVIEGPYDQGYRGYGSYDGETTDIDADHLSPVSSTERCPHVTPPANLSAPCQICGALGPWFDSGDCRVSSKTQGEV